MSIVVYEKEQAVISASCDDCVASKGGFKHAIAFLAWIHRRSEDAATTSVKCCWKRSTLAQTSIKSVKAKDIKKKITFKTPETESFCLQKFNEHSQGNNVQLAR